MTFPMKKWKDYVREAEKTRDRLPSAEREFIERYPCGWCDFFFTLLLSLIIGAVVHFVSGAPWWLIVFITHGITAKWFLETRQ
jgi:F0F1-type ATP synthase assembly protein I